MSEDRSQVRDRALTTLDEIRAALQNDDIQGAVQAIDVLQGQLVDWKRADAREWLDRAFGVDLLLFNADGARQRLNQWAGTLAADADDELLATYRQRVTARTQEKQLELQARGVIAHCEELWRQAHALERDDNPAHPDRLLSEYFATAQEIAESAAHEYPDNDKLIALNEKANRLYEQKQKARRIYAEALEDEAYAEAMDDLDALTVVELVPRFRQKMAGDEPGLMFVGMATVQQARAELQQMGRQWADQHIADMLQKVHNELSQYDPQAALDLLSQRKRIERFAEPPIQQKMLEYENRAADDLRRRQHAERRCQQALHLLADNPLGAWDIYTEAQTLYAGAPSLGDARERILQTLLSDLDDHIRRAEEAFDARLMERVSQIYQAARLDFSDKAPELEERLGRLAEIDWQARTFIEYRQGAEDLLERLRDVIISDVGSASDLLSQLEDYPAIVLEDLDGLAEARAAIRRRLNLEMRYNRLYKLLHSDRSESVETAIAEAASVDENRFRQLAHDLDVHLTYLNAHVEYQLGQNREALSLFAQVAGQQGHPDQVEAERYAAEIQQALMPAPPPPETDPDDFNDEYTED
jgi:hypothetical protein